MKTENNSSYVKQSITKSLLELMEDRSFMEITITDIAKNALVGRASFYRNFSSKEDVLKQYLLRLIREWGTEFENSKSPNIVVSLFGHYKKYSEFYLLLYREGLSYLVLDNIRSVCGPKPDQDDIPAYFSAWFAGALFGWIRTGVMVWTVRIFNYKHFSHSDKVRYRFITKA
ncbi:TetR/AcrR family transcriptional regulator [Paenibacillus massiliensis]|uniref:TetR/AcrR family transcriptional regulator n=1 Tax=Paenibacillus massiliensis TaxID=225917 RepID=UPI00047140EE|nr:TetR/AcrR family transcriptional regulator [Paenibacillus massiliensis]